MREGVAVEINAPARVSAGQKWNMAFFSMPVAYAGMTGTDFNPTATMDSTTPVAYQFGVPSSNGMNHLTPNFNISANVSGTVNRSEVRHKAFWIGVKYIDGENFSYENWRNLPTDSFVVLPFQAPFGEEAFVVTGASVKLEYTGPRLTASGSCIAWKQQCLQTDVNITTSSPFGAATPAPPAPGKHGPYSLGMVCRIPPPPGFSNTSTATTFGSRNKIESIPNLQSQTLKLVDGCLLVVPISWKTMLERTRNPINRLDECDPYSSRVTNGIHVDRDQYIHCIYPACTLDPQAGDFWSNVSATGGKPTISQTAYGRFVSISETRVGAHFQGLEQAATFLATGFMVGYREPAAASDVWLTASEPQSPYDSTILQTLQRVSDTLPVAAPAHANGFGSWLAGAASSIKEALSSPIAKSITRPLREVARVAMPRRMAAIEAAESIADKVIPGKRAGRKVLRAAEHADHEEQVIEQELDQPRGQRTPRRQRARSGAARGQGDRVSVSRGENGGETIHIPASRVPFP
jgi:hypothetical protein